MFPRFLYAAILAFTALPLQVQAAAASEPMVRVDLMPISLSGKLEVYYSANGKVCKLEAFETGIGSPVFYKGTQTLRLFATEADARPRLESEPQSTPLATVLLPAGVRRVLLLPVPKPDAKLEVRALGVDDKSLMAGDYRIYNLSQLELIGLIGKKPLRLKPGQSQDISDSSMREKDDDFGVQIAYMKEHQQKMIYSAMWGHSIQARNFIFMIGTGKPNSPVSVRKFHDIPNVPSIGYEPEQAGRP
jgi:hypothetical protein